LDSLQPSGALVDERLAQPGAGAPLAHLRGRIQASGSRPSQSSVRSQRASSRSVLARRLLPRRALVSTGLARCGMAPPPPTASQTNSQPVQASTDRGELEVLLGGAFRLLFKAIRLLLSSD
jgi:hypothetical protein